MTVLFVCMALLVNRQLRCTGQGHVKLTFALQIGSRIIAGEDARDTNGTPPLAFQKRKISGAMEGHTDFHLIVFVTVVIQIKLLVFSVYITGVQTPF